MARFFNKITNISITAISPIWWLVTSNHQVPEYITSSHGAPEYITSSHRAPEYITSSVLSLFSFPSHLIYLYLRIPLPTQWLALTMSTVWPVVLLSLRAVLNNKGCLFSCLHFQSDSKFIVGILRHRNWELKSSELWDIAVLFGLCTAQRNVYLSWVHRPPSL